VGSNPIARSNAQNVRPEATPSRGASAPVIARSQRGPARSGRPDDRLRDEAIPAPAHKNWIASLALAMTKQMRSRGAPRPSFGSRRTKTPGPIPSDGRRRWYRLPSRSRPAHKNQEGETPTDAKPSVRIDGCGRAPDLSSLRRVWGGQGGARSPVGVPPRRLRQRTNAAAQLQNALPGTRLLQALAASRLSQSSELLADRSWCRPGVFPEPPENGSDEPPPAGTALAPAAGVTRLPSFKLSEIRYIGIRNRDKCQ
jgi:hypothetical protein